MASCGYSISWFVEFYQIIIYRINRSLKNWYLSKLNETTVNKSHDDILRTSLRKRYLLKTREKKTSFVVILHSHFFLYCLVGFELRRINVEF